MTKNHITMAALKYIFITINKSPRDSHNTKVPMTIAINTEWNVFKSRLYP
jgi:hypothetical protein